MYGENGENGKKAQWIPTDHESLAIPGDPISKCRLQTSNRSIHVTTCHSRWWNPRVPPCWCVTLCVCVYFIVFRRPLLCPNLDKRAENQGCQVLIRGCGMAIRPLWRADKKNVYSTFLIQLGTWNSYSSYLYVALLYSTDNGESLESRGFFMSNRVKEFTGLKKTLLKSSGSSTQN